MSASDVEYSEGIGRLICELIAIGTPLKVICKRDDMPERRNVYHWTEKYASFRDSLTRARLAQADSYADEIVEIADTEDDYQKAKNRIDARKWAAKVINPQRYGDRLELNVAERPNLADIRSQSLANLPPGVAERLAGTTEDILDEPVGHDISQHKRPDELGELIDNCTDVDQSDVSD